VRGRVFGAALAVVLTGAVLVCAGGTGAAPQFVVVLRTAQPHVSAARALALARSLGFTAPSARTEASAFVAGEGQRELVLYKASGGFDYIDRAAFGKTPAAPLPTKAEARTAALGFLRRHGLLPGQDARVGVRPDLPVSPRSMVVTVMPLSAGAAVLDGAVTLWLGPHAAVTRLRDEYRPLSAGAVRVVGRPRKSVLAEVRRDLGTTNGIRLRLAYVAEPSYLPQTYLEPVYEAVARGFVLDRVPATTFTPRATIRSPNPNYAIRAGVNVALRTNATAGKRPYRFLWYANRSGYLGTGNKVTGVFAADDTELRLTVRDASGAGMTYAMPIWVYGPSTLARSSVPVSSQQQPTELGDGSVSFTASQDRTHPLLFRTVRAGGTTRIDSAYFDQFRYSIVVRYQGTDYHLASRKCVPLTVPGDACVLPKSPYAQSGGATAPAAGGSGSWVYSTVEVDNLPGRLKLVVEGSAERAYCGPNGELGAIALGMPSKFVYGTGGKIGGDCPGFRPSVQWSYGPPLVFRPSDFARLCLQGEGLCDVPQGLLLEWAGGGLDGGPQPQITDFRLNVYTAVDSSGSHERAALAQDSDSNTKLAATDGAVDTSCRPWHVAVGALGLLSRTDAFTCIRPIERERSAVLATVGGRGQWDNLHLKSENPAPYGISFPGCNHPMSSSDIPDCIHLHEHWLGSTPGPNEAYSRGQNVTVYVVRWNPGEASPDSPEALVNGEPLRINADEGYDLSFWHRSVASSKDCFPAGGVDNTDRPCLVFPQAMFFTPR
jgi:hypothetical protein